MKSLKAMMRLHKKFMYSKLDSPYCSMLNRHYTVQTLSRNSICMSSSNNICNAKFKYFGYLHDLQKIQKVHFHKSKTLTLTEVNRGNYNSGNNDEQYQKIIITASMMAVLGFVIYRTSKTECQEDQCVDINDKILYAREILMKIKDEYGCPGVAVCVSLNGNVIWTEGMGYSNIENRVPCTPDSVMRIASISKPMTVAILARLWEEGKIDLDKPVGEYVKGWPDKTFEGEKVSITTRHLLSHIGGIRHYDKTCNKVKADTKSNNKVTDKSDGSDKSKKEKNNLENTNQNRPNKEKTVTKDDNKPSSEFEQKEYFIKRHFHNVSESLELFKNDNLCSKPGSKFLYTTHGYTLLSAVIETVSGKSFTTLAKQLFTQLGLENTFLDEYQTIIYNRASYFIKNKNGKLLNAPYVDVSYKWGGGGFISTVGDIVKFGNAMLYSYQQNDLTNNKEKGYLRPETVKMLWSPISHTGWDEDSGWYGMGWGVMPEVKRYAFGKQREFSVSHTGGAIGASSVLFILPTNNCNIKKKQISSKENNSLDKVEDDTQQNKDETLPQGVVVGIIVNMQGVGLNTAAMKIANIFAAQ